MTSRFSLLVGTALLGALLAAPASAQTVPPPGPPTDPKRGWVDAPAKLPKLQRGDLNRNVEFLFEALKIAPDAASAKSIEDRIWAVWFVSGGDTANLLMTRVKTAVEGEDTGLAIKLLDAVIELKPDYVEAWNRRATIYYMRKEYEQSLQDIRQVLAREPRHFGALAGLGLIMQDLGEDKRALDMYRRALAIHPHLPRIPDLVKTLTEKVEGRPI